MSHKLFPGLRSALLLTVLISWTGCGSPASEIAVADQGNPCFLLPLWVYTPAFSAALADEIEAASASAKWPEVVRAYMVLRDDIKACREAK